MRNRKENSEIELFVSCGEGLESLLMHELQQLGYDQLTGSFRGVFVQAKDLSAIYKINYCSRIASRVFLPIIKFACRFKDDLYQNAMRVDWLRYIPRGYTFAIDANVSHPHLKNSLFAAQLLKDAICDKFREKTGNRPSVDVQHPDVQLNLFVHNKIATISFDTSRTPLHKRGYRIGKGEAPLQENLAAALLMVADYQGSEVVFDPCCGSGTLLIEAALMATRTPPGYLRRDWGFMALPQFSQTAWLKVKNEADEERIRLPQGLLRGCDKNKEMVEICKGNLRAAGFQKEIQIEQADFQNYDLSPAPNFIITNPPHGLRLESPDELIPLYRDLGHFMKRKTAKPAKGFILTGNLDLAKEVGLAPKRRHVVMNGGVECRFLEFDLYDFPKKTEGGGVS